jgi:basic amino acid/polyamine antiporter, APA family
VRVKVKNKNLDYSTATGKPTLAFIDAVALIVGIVIGAGIFETPAFVAANTGSDELLLLTWVLGGGMSLIGAVCYAELATAYPHPGGNYYYLQRAFGKAIAFLFAWGRMTVIQTGSLALLAFVFGDYASQILPLGDYSSSVYAALAIGILTVLNLIGIRQGTKLVDGSQSLGVVISCHCWFTICFAFYSCRTN